jgi:UDP-2,3-diacylglucosamine pyrophosphatase LpxH
MNINQLDNLPYWMEDIESDESVIQESDKQHHHYRAIFISDVHLGSKGAKAEFLSNFLKYNHSKKLYLVGDIIDCWRLKKRMFWPQEHTNVIRRILTKSKRETDIIFVTGNHDDLLRRYSGLNFGNISLADEAVYKRENGEKILVVHGDKYDSVVQSQKWLAIVGDWAYETLVQFNTIFNKIRNLLGMRYWSLSSFIKKKVKSAVSFISAYEEAVAKDCQLNGYKGVVCGHIHQSEIRVINGIDYYNCGDWIESCTAIVETLDGEMKLLKWVEIDHKQPHQTETND